MKDNCQKILDLAFELEGLAKLRLSRPEEEPELDRHIAAKIEALASLNHVAAQTPTADKPVGNSIATEAADADDDLLYSIEDEADDYSEPQPDFDQVEETDFEPEPLPEAEFVDDPEPEAEPEAAAVCDLQPPTHTEIKTETKAKVEAKPEAKAEAKPMPPISINDRFRFRRELFGGSTPDFDAALNLIATMDSFDEAHDYFICELDWDPEQPVVEEFMDMLRRYFAKR